MILDSDNTWGETPPRKPSSASRGTRLYDLRVDDPDYTRVAEQMQSTIREHRDCAGGVFNRYNIIKVCVQHVCDRLYIMFSYMYRALNFLGLICKFTNKIQKIYLKVFLSESTWCILGNLWEFLDPF